MCAEDWVGVECDVNLFLNSTYLPPLDFVRQSALNESRHTINRVDVSCSGGGVGRGRGGGRGAGAHARACMSAKRWMSKMLRVRGQVNALYAPQR